jgi:hypothetical protein
MDTVGVIKPESHDGGKIILNVTDGYSGMVIAVELHSKADVCGELKRMLVGLETQTGRKTKRIRTDNGTEFLKTEFVEWLKDRGTDHDRSAPGNPEQNGVAERSNQTLCARIRCLMLGAGLTAEYWGEALPAAVMLLNITPKTGNKLSRVEMFTRRKPTTRFLRRFGCLAYVKLQKHGKFDAVSVAGMFIGYSQTQKAYRVAVGGKCVLVSPSVVFDESRNGIEVLKGRASIPASLRPQPVGGLQPLPGHEEEVHLENGESYTLQWLGQERLAPVENPVETGEFMDVERKFSGPKEVDRTPQPGEAPEEVVDPVRNLGERLRYKDVAERIWRRFPELEAEEQRGRETSKTEGHSQRGEGPDRAAEALADRIRRMGRAPGEGNPLAGCGEGQTPLEREPDYPAEAPSDTPVTKRLRRMPDRYVPGAYACRARKVVNGVVIPRTYEEAMESPEAPFWRHACEEEMKSHDEHKTFEVKTCPEGITPIPCKWVFDVKTDETGKIVRWKARLVAQGNWQIPGLDFGETFAPVASQVTRRVFFAMGAEQDWEIHQVDVKTAFLHGTVDEELYMLQPPGFHSGKENEVCKLVKSLYGLRQSPRQWHRELCKVFGEIGLTPCEGDPGLFKRESEGESPVYVEVYVDDMLIGGKDLKGVQETKEMLAQKFEIHDLGQVKYFLGLLVERDRAARTITISAALKIQELLVKYGQEDAHPAPTPMTKDFMQTRLPMGSGKDGKQGSGKLLEKGHRYSELIGSLQYLASNVRPEISQAVNVLSRYRNAPTTSHWNAGMRVLRYLKGDIHGGITYGKKTHPIHGYVDSDYAGDLDTRQSTTGFVFLMNGGPISWCSKKQNTVASSTVEAEYLAFHAATKEARWLSTLLGHFGRPTVKVPLEGDNMGCMANLKNPIQSKFVKHIDVAYHVVREWVARGVVVPSHVETEKNVADLFTKPLPGPVFERHKKSMGLERK